MRVQPACLVDILAYSIHTDETGQQGLVRERKHHDHHEIVESSVWERYLRIFHVQC